MSMMCKNSFCKSFCFIVIIITLFASCYSREEREIRRLIGRKVDLTGPYLYMDSINVFDTIPYGSGVRIMTILDYNECYTCTFKALINLQNLIQKEKNIYSDINVLAVAKQLDIEKAQNELKRWNLKTILMVDSTDYYIRKNHFEKLLHRNRTFIIDNANRIVLVGDPILSRQLRPQFLKILNNLCANGGTYIN